MYDANGNTVSSGGITNTYDFENHLIGQGGATMVYDGDGNRVKKTVAGVTTTYLVGGWPALRTLGFDLAGAPCSVCERGAIVIGGWPMLPESVRS